MAMYPESNDTDDQESRLEQVLADYLHAAEAGKPLDQQALLERHPDLVDELKSFFANRGALEHLVEPLKGAAFEPTLGLEEKVTDEMHRIRYFGDYELLEELGRGGMGVVYKARQTTLNRLVAIKMILSGQLASPDDVQRFKQEAESAANLDHPHIAPIYETGEHQGQHYFSMKFIEGRSLREVLPELQNDVHAGAKLFSQVARAVHHAHQRGVLHRDLKPANVLLDREGTPYVTDFGLAKRVEGGSDVTKTGAIVGTPSYMAPEQAMGEKQLTTAVDVYSLGSMLYELLTGRPPFKAESPLETLLQVMSAESARPQSLNPRADRDLETISLKCLEKESVKRYDSAAALADDLERWLKNEPIVARPAGRMERLLKWSKRRPAAAAVVAVSLVSVAFFMAALLWALDRERERAQSERDLREQAVVAKTAAEKAESATRDQVVQFQVRRGVEHLEQRDDFLAFLWFAQALQSESPNSPRQEAHRLRLSLLLQRLPRLRGYFMEPEEWFTDLAFTPDDKQIRTVGYHQGLRRWNPDGGTPLGDPIPIRAEGATWGRFSDDGQFVLYDFNDDQGNQQYAVWDAADGKLVLDNEKFKDASGDRVQVSMTPAPVRWLKQTHRKKEVVYEVFDLRTMKPIYSPLKIEENLGTPSIGPGGKQVAFLAEKKQGNDKRLELHHYDLSTGKPVWPAILVAESDAGHWRFCRLHFSPDGKRLLTDVDAGWRRRVRLWDAVKGEPLTPEILPAYPSIFEYEPFSAESKWFFVEERQVGLRAYPQRRFGGFGEPIRPPGRIERVVHSPQGDSLATVSGNTTTGSQAGAEGSVIGLWSPEGQLRHPYLHLSSGLKIMRFSPDGHQLACLTDDRKVFVWDMSPRGFTVPPELPETHNGEGLGFSADGRWVAIGTLEDDVDKKGSKATLRVFDTATGKPVSPAIAPYNPESTTYRGFLPEKVAFSPDGKYLATLCEGRGKPQDQYLDIRVWDVATGEAITPPIVGQGATKNLGIVHHGFAFSPDGRWIYARLNDGNFPAYVTRVWDAQTGKPFDPGVPYDFAAFSADGSRVLLAQNEGNFLRFDPKLKKIQPTPALILDVRTGQPLGPPIPLAQCWVHHACFSPDGERVALDTHDPGQGSTHIVDVRTSKIVAGPLSLSIFANCFSADGRRIICASRNKQKVCVCDTATGEPLSPMIQFPDICAQAEFAADDLALVTLSNQHTQLWDSHTGAPLTPPIPSLGYSLRNDRNLMVRVSAYTARFFDLQSLDWPANDVLKVAELLSGHRMDNFGTLLPLSHDEVHRAWNDLWPRYLKQHAQAYSP